MFTSTIVLMLYPVALIMAIAFLAFAAYRRVVPSNQVHIVQSSKKSEVYGIGREAGNAYYAWPSFIPGIGVVVSTFSEAIFPITLTRYLAYDSAKVPFVIDVSAFFCVRDAKIVAHRVSNHNELKSQLENVLEGAVRRVLASNTLEVIMESRSVLGSQFSDEVSANLSEWGIETAKTIEFKDIGDATGTNVIANIMAKDVSRIELESRIAVAGNRRAAEIAEINAKREIDVQRQDAMQHVSMRTAEKETIVGVAQERSVQEIKAEIMKTTERELDIQRMTEIRTAEIKREVSKVATQEMQDNAVIKAETEQKTRLTSATSEKETASIIAEGNLIKSRNEAAGLEAVGNAKAAVEKALQMAPVSAQTELANQIGSNQEYQNYMVRIREVEKEEKIGIAMAAALENADLKVIANTGDVKTGVTSLSSLLSPTGGVAIGGALEAFANTPTGKMVINKFTGAE